MPEITPADISTLVLDVDGVLTDGTLVYDDTGRELKAFSVRDGFGIKLFLETGRSVAIITARGGEMVRRRATELGIEVVIERSENKAEALREVSGRLGVDPLDMAYLGDDWPDLPAMALVGYPMAVADAEAEVKAVARFVTARPGGRGAVRDAVNHLLRESGELGDRLGGFTGSAGRSG